ncbi:MAG: RagB/SusD family nutrient uptake outer membrane protein, partial [Bacteroidales bacterium]|nr:RagB/SusD family nutrient uptake outer membrane protein [Bacteroidales bacterium]
PASDGYPIAQSAVYDPQKPYENRDDRLAIYIIYNGSSFKQADIFTHTGDPIDGINAQETSTRTGYYLRKFMNESVLLDPKSESDHFYTYLRATEVFLNFAEAANEYGGPAHQVSGISARDVMHALRERAGITDHTYIDGLDRAGMRNAIRNERRIELCFEGYRFWDIRRWNLTDEMNQSVSAIYIAPDFSYSVQQVAEIFYAPHMYYGPVPYDEILKMDIKQNDGW